MEPGMELLAKIKFCAINIKTSKRYQNFLLIPNITKILWSHDWSRGKMPKNFFSKFNAKRRFEHRFGSEFIADSEYHENVMVT